MKFDSWMRSTKLSESSVLKYYGAVKGALSDWAKEAGLVTDSILNITSATKFDAISKRINELDIFQERNSTGHSMYSNALNKYSEYLKLGAIPSVEEDIEQIITNEKLAETEKSQLIKSRLGQGKFRSSLIEFWKCCSVTAYTDTSLLVASHIKPWSKSLNAERLDKYNGLLLIPNLDKVFDQGLATFDKTGKIIFSPSLQNPGLLGLSENMGVKLSDEHQGYMEFHRNNVFNNT